MLLNEHKALWNKIREFPLNEPGAAITFSTKLQEQQKWNAPYTERVIEEYRKFIFLCCIAPKGASPSKAVDEAWHMHLTYTQSYWIELCKNTLGRDIHHHPSKGGDAENHKHADWYKETLDIYRQAFGSDPPPDIWPPPFEVQAVTEIPEPRFKLGLETYIVIVLILLAPFLVISIFFDTFWPYNLTGPEFLVAFPIFIVSLFCAHCYIEKKKEWFYEELVIDNFNRGANVFQQAKFIFGRHRAIQAALVDLLRRELLEVRNDRTFIIRNKYYYAPEHEENPLIEKILKEEDQSEIKYDFIDVNWYDEEKLSHPSLSRLYRFAYTEKSFREKYLVSIVILLFGLSRVLQGWANNRPTGFLIAEILILIIIGRFVQKNYSRVGTIFRKAENLFHHQAIMQNLYKDDVVAHYAVKGNEAIRWFAEGAILATVFAAYVPMRHTAISGAYTNNHSGIGSCSSCGGSSCGGGGGGAGGGCGGGGCGGCGGGD